MSKTRVYELAKELGLENKALLDLCVQLGMDDKKSHSNSLSDDEAERIRRFVIRRAVADKGAAVRELTREGQLVTEQRMGSIIRRRKKTAEEGEEDEAEKKAAPAFTLDELKPIERALPTLAPDLEAERRVRNEALRKADELFYTQKERSEEEEEDLESAQPERELPEEQEQPAEALAEGAVEEQSLQAAGDEELPEGDEQAEQSAAEEPQTEEEQKAAESRFSAERLADVRRRHDIRAPRVLGKIELPIKEPPKKPAASTEGGAEAEAGEEEGAAKAWKGKKRRPVTAAAETTDSGERKRPRKKQVLRKDELLDYDGEREVWRKKEKKAKKPRSEERMDGADAVRAGKKVIKIDGEVSVGELAHQLSVKASEVIAKLMKLGVMSTINKLIDFDTATIVAEDFGHSTVNTEHDVEEYLNLRTGAEAEEVLELRPPVVTVMGHVDHGKTSLLDAIRKTTVTAAEVGGITQHIGAYNVRVPSGGSVTFLDTPGHEAFTAMRGRGAKVTDIVVLVVAADDGVMPQTIEAINHAKAANVPIIVAINKIDKENGNPDRVLSQLAEYGLTPEEWGGETLVVRVSAHTRQGLDQLLESLDLQAEILELKANRNRSAVGTIIESKLDRGRGPVITVLVQNGTLKKGDAFVCGPVFGKVRALVSDDGNAVVEAGPSIPVEVVGASAPAASGDDFIVLDSDVQARKIAEERGQRLRRKELASASAASISMGPLTLEKFSAMVTESAEVKELPLIVKADVQGSVEALAEALARLSNEEVKVKIIHRGVGAITENDVQLASASKAVLVAFNIRPDARASHLLESEGLDVLYSRVIYDLVDSVQEALKGRMAPKYQEKTLGRVEVRQTFKVPRQGTVAGSYVLDGVVPRNALVRLLRDGIVMFEGKLASLRRFKEDVKEVTAGYECGIGLEGYTDIKDGDVMEVYKVEEVI